MKNSTIVLILIVLASCSEDAPSYDVNDVAAGTDTMVIEAPQNPDSIYIAEIQALRDEKDIEYADTATSPLNPDSIATFTGLNYYPIEPFFCITAPFTRESGEPFMMPTSSGMLKEFQQYGYAVFELEAQPCTLYAYQNLKVIQDTAHADYLFIPFNDMTNGGMTYGGGRYIETVLPEGDSIVLDFNQCFNPYCHYGDGWNCPIPPDENDLPVYIFAGEKLLYEDDLLK